MAHLASVVFMPEHPVSRDITSPSLLCRQMRRGQADVVRTRGQATGEGPRKEMVSDALEELGRAKKLEPYDGPEALGPRDAASLLGILLGLVKERAGPIPGRAMAVGAVGLSTLCAYSPPNLRPPVFEVSVRREDAGTLWLDARGHTVIFSPTPYLSVASPPGWCVRDWKPSRYYLAVSRVSGPLGEDLLLLMEALALEINALLVGETSPQ